VTGDQFSEVELDLLADYVGGVLEGTPDEAVVARRIADDPAWQAAYEELTGAMATVGAQLNALGAGAEPMPADVAARLDAALTDAPPRLTVLPGGRADTPRRRPRWTAPVAVAAAVAVFAGVGGGYLLHRPGGSSGAATSTAAGSAEDKAPVPLAAPSVPLPAAGRITSSGRDYQAGTLGNAAVRAPFASAKAGSDSDDTSPDTPRAAISPTEGLADPLGRLRLPDALQACLDALAAENGSGALTVERVDYARYAEKPAIVVVFTAANGRFAWASGPDCGAPGVGSDRLKVVPVG
jgi:hypothetical protein